MVSIGSCLILSISSLLLYQCVGMNFSNGVKSFVISHIILECGDWIADTMGLTFIVGPSLWVLIRW